ncbi:MAG: Asp-tRNA(Asn)/Glu-tRNA(Gln) amidotransferase subunit GatB [Atribacterota bacterium]|jgi:aspartyl-tRNA(Asn)/glutamyl-tRNA(Gln) amidotransferase subunit B|nr:Asp-tRNA(Asn)/Glu-tRNA(Gln) amidotransferase subunit GatB [Atribacterota bacterium]MDD4288012.1 Asp-tRNA(Asn)/Glu-tRNA(Gln) amidotransferase subunit GatB [Atribacterota bacterium]MDI9596384.1 Asp-tRNA(Asn)/Glu-tRNA(Gln) amidotransferase subunit GatB [Atribacterota bacterium]
MQDDIVIGLEIHVQLLTQTKLFCHCSTDYIDREPNTNTCPVCLGLPGCLPVLNKKAVELAVRTAIALNCHINTTNIFHRKNYFYPDLPKAYQISQYDLPLAGEGYLEILTGNQNEKVRIRINRAHMEEDAGKLVHIEENGRITGSLVDYNRSCIPLLEIVTEPDIHSSDEAIIFLQNLRSIVQYLGVCDGNLERGSMRCDANISIRDSKTHQLGTKTEVKNMNSFRAIKKALDYEIIRQRKMIEDGEKILQETRRWDEANNKTISMRTKEEAHDYRYFPEPDLLPLTIESSWIKEIEDNLPELPADRKKRFVKDFGLSEYNADRLVEVKSLGDYFEEAVGHYKNYEKLTNWILSELLGYLSEDSIDISSSPVSAERLTELLVLIDRNIISGKIAKTIFEKMYKTGQRAEELVQESGLTQISDKSEIDTVIEKVISQNYQSVQDYHSGKEKALNYLVGQVMRYTKGRAQPDLVLDLLKEKVNKLSN